MRERTYPFVPKSALSLRAGEFWSIPLHDGSFACGRVVQAAATFLGASRVLFIGALLDWHEKVPPTEASIANRKCLAMAKAHIKTIESVGGAVLGFRPLELDRIVAPVVRSGLGDAPGQVLFGLEPLRAQKKSDSKLPTLSVWGAQYVRAFAERTFLRAA